MTIAEILDDCWNHSRSVTVLLRNGERYTGIPKGRCAGNEWCELTEYSRYHTVAPRTHHVCLAEIAACSMGAR